MAGRIARKKSVVKTQKRGPAKKATKTITIKETKGNKKLFSQPFVKKKKSKKANGTQAKKKLARGGRIIPTTLAEIWNDKRRPSKVEDSSWIIAARKDGNFAPSSPNTGKWLVFVQIENLDTVWEKIREATEKGLLGDASKVATARPSSRAKDPSEKVICIYTYDYTDVEDVMRVRLELRNLGVDWKIPYKTDQATYEQKYQVTGHKKISMYYI
jgi:hypothetical protein